jgi:hypothetical protein
MISAPAIRDARTAAADVVRQARLVSGNVGHVTGEAIDGARDAAHRARRAVRRGYRNAVDFRDEVAYRVKHRPLEAIGLSFAVGLCAGYVSERIRATWHYSNGERGASR